MILNSLFTKGLDSMFILSFYLFWVGYTYLMGLLFGLDFHNFDNPFFYILGLLAILLGFALSFITQLSILSIVGDIRKGSKIDNKLNHRFGNSLLNLGRHLLRVKVVVTGKENIPTTNFVFVSNHQENYDLIILKPIFKNIPLSFIAKEALQRAPFFGKWVELLGNILISKDADRSAAESIVKGIRRVKEGLPMGIFPEGKRSFSNEMIDFKPGAFKLAMKPKADILICTIYNFAEIYKKIPFRRLKVYVHIHEILKYDDYKELNSIELSKRVKAIIQEKLDEYKKNEK